MIEAVAQGAGDAKARSHVDSCAFCRHRVHEAQKFYLQFLAEWQKPLSLKERHLVSRFNRPTQRWTVTPVHTLAPAVPRSVYAAATSLQVREPRIKRVGLLSSPDQDVLIRLLQDTRSGDVHLFLLMSNPEVEWVAVTIPNLDFTEYTPTNSSLNLGPVSVTEWKQWTIQIRTPDQSWEPVPDTDGEELQPGQVRMSCTEDPSWASLDTKIIWENSPGMHRDRVMVLVTKADTLLQATTVERASPAVLRLPRETGLRLQIFS
ncbi:MAG: hypothetical protein D6762_07850 [Candidatus Neomarinimicrobiota bacterium]|nr:MAG: hypothetical protein D6762_07850 [Candidatus Neomarinimicrobiota bacterium]